MSIYKGTTLISGIATNTITNGHNLLDFKWSDHELNDQSWLNANTFSWQDGTVYSDAYSHLVADYSGGTSKTETIGSHTITFVEATDGHRITTDESTVADIYTESGVAWFYVLDTTNQRFKLPRSTHGQIVERLTSGSQWANVYADGWCEQGDALFGTDITVTFLKEFADNNYSFTYSGGGTLSSGTAQVTNNRTTTGIFFKNNANNYATNKASWRACGYISSTPNNTPYQKLYFYVGQFSQSATEQTAGLNASLFNGKVDLDGNNATFPHIVESYVSGTNWYNIYSNKFCEQGGYASSGATTQVTLLAQFKDTNYTVDVTILGTSSGNYAMSVNKDSGSQISIYSTGNATSRDKNWRACGYIS